MESGTATITSSGATSVLANDSDPDGDAITAVKITNPSRGTVTLNANGTFLYTHDGSNESTDSFTYSANDGKINSTPIEQRGGHSTMKKLKHTPYYYLTLQKRNKLSEELTKL